MLYCVSNPQAGSEKACTYPSRNRVQIWSLFSADGTGSLCSALPCRGDASLLRPVLSVQPLGALKM